MKVTVNAVLIIKLVSRTHINTLMYYSCHIKAIEVLQPIIWGQHHTTSHHWSLVALRVDTNMHTDPCTCTHRQINTHTYANANRQSNFKKPSVQSVHAWFEQACCEHLSKETWVNIILAVHFIKGMFNSRLVAKQSGLVIRMSEHIIMGRFQGWT